MEKQILILTTTNDFLRKFEQENVKILQQMGYTVHYAANMREPHYLSDEEKIRAMGVHTHHIEIARSPFLIQDNRKALRRISDLIRNYQIQILHCHTPVGGLLGRLAGKFCRERKLFVIYTAHGFHFYRGAPLLNHLVYAPVEKVLARYTDALIVINEEDYKNARRFLLKKGGHVYKIPGVGLDRERFRPLSEEARKAGRARLGIGPEDFFLLSVGELNDNKNQKIVLDALVRLRRRDGPITKIRYGVCGDGFLRNRMEQWISEMNLADNVTLYGHCSDIPEILGCADAMIFPSKREGLGMAGLEALAMGVPVIAADNRGTREYMEHGINGFVYRYDDADGFAEGITAVRSLSEEQRREMEAYCINSVQQFDKNYAQAVMRRIYAEADRKAVQETYERQSKNQRYNGYVQSHR